MVTTKQLQYDEMVDLLNDFTKAEVLEILHRDYEMTLQDAKFTYAIAMQNMF